MRTLAAIVGLSLLAGCVTQERVIRKETRYIPPPNSYVVQRGHDEQGTPYLSMRPSDDITDEISRAVLRPSYLQESAQVGLDSVPAAAKRFDAEGEGLYLRGFFPDITVGVYERDNQKFAVVWREGEQRSIGIFGLANLSEESRGLLEKYVTNATRKQ